MLLIFEIPGEPVAQGRPRAFRMPGGQIRAYDPAKSRSWKAEARAVMALRLREWSRAELLTGPLDVTIRAIFTCPASQYRKREPLGRRPHAKRPDAENVAKSVLDAATGVVWVDDSQVARLSVEKIIGAQGEAPRVEVCVTPIEVGA
jgi:Holliday junction resolvase RusA-like endonuclease